MGAHRHLMFVAGVLVISFTSILAVCLAQMNSGMPPAQIARDAEGCADIKVLPKLAASTIVSCDKGESIEVIMPLRADVQGNSREKSVRGIYEFREYQIPQVYQGEQAFQSLMQWLPLAGFTIKYSSSPTTITARRQDIWVLVSVNGEYYDVKAVRERQEPWAPVKDAQNISQQMQVNKRVAIYGIEFSPDDQTVVEEHSRILGEILTYLKGSAGLTIVVESHTMSKNGNAQSDQEITRRRAQAVVTWLEAHGIASGRMRPEAFGRNKPLTENDTLLEIQINDRIELVRVAP